MAKADDLQLFLSSEEYGEEGFRAETWREAIGLLKDLYREATSQTQEDGIDRKIGFLITGTPEPYEDGDEEEDES